MKGVTPVVALIITVLGLTDHTQASTALAGPVSKEYCSPESFDVSCDPGHVILMRSATYGRMRLSRCIGGVSLGCKSDVIAHLDKVCSGRQKCKIDVNDLEKVAQPCPKDYKAYLEAEYECVRAISTEICDTQTYVSLSEQKGYIVGHTGGEHSRVSISRCTFAIEVDPGQRVGLYMYSIGAHPYSGAPIGEVQKHKTPCHDHMTIEDGADRKTTNLCDLSRPSRQHHLYTSDSNNVVLHTRLGKSDQESYFMILYRAVGCPDVTPPTNSWVERTGDDLVVRCNTTGDIWYLTCQGNQWVGQIGNCSHSLPGFGAVFGNGIPIQQGIALAVGVGILVGAVFGALLLLCVWTIKKGAPEPVKPSKRVDGPPTKNYITEERTNYPALLGQDRTTTDTAVYEYTHVWDPRSQSMEKRIEKKVIPHCKNAQQYNTDMNVNTLSSGRVHCENPHSRIHLYETPKGVVLEEHETGTTGRYRSSDTPVYFDLDPEVREKVERPH